MNRIIKNSLRNLFCIFCIMLTVSFSKSEISIAVVLPEMSASTEPIKVCKNNTVNTTLYDSNTSQKNENKIYDYKKTKTTFPKKKKKIIRQPDFEVKVLPQGNYTAQIDNDSNIIVTKKTMIIK